MKKLGLLSATLAIMCLATAATAGTFRGEADGGATWQAGIDGVEIEWAPTGGVKRISSRYSVPVEFGDRRGIAKAQVIAEEKAKAGIIRFLEQAVTSTRVVTEVQNDLNRATQERGSGKAATVTKVDNRTIMEALTEVTTSIASGRLRGVIVLEKGYSDKSDEAWVVVGISDKSLKAAGEVKAMGEDKPPEPKAGGENSVARQPSETRRLNTNDW